MFQPDDKPEQWTLLQNIFERHHPGGPNYDGGLYIHGVVNQEIPGLTTEGPEKPSKHATADPTNPSPVTLYNGGKTAPIPVPSESMVPKAIKDVFHDWAAEVMNQGVHVHSKVIVIDPFGKKPVVITGSHNLGYKASTKNDDNMMIVEGNAPLAAAYAANIIAIYQTYRWNTYVDAHAKDPQVWHGLVDNATWQDSYLNPNGDDLAEIKFWLGEGASTGAPAAAPAPGGTEVRAATASGPSRHVSKPAKKKTPANSAPARKAPAKSRRAAGKKDGGESSAPQSRGCSIDTRRRQIRAAEEGQTGKSNADKVESRSREEGASEDQQSSRKVEARAREKDARKDAESRGEESVRPRER